MSNADDKALPLRMDAYYYGFDLTGVRAIDRVLSAVACAGKAFHHTIDWYEKSHRSEFTGDTPVEWIQNAAAKAADEIAKLRDALQWFIDNDETNVGDEPIEYLGGRTWNEVNAYYIDGLNRARAALRETGHE